MCGRHHCWTWPMSLARFHIFLFMSYLCLSVGSCASSTSKLNSQYGIFLDGGSTSTKLRIYQWQTPNSRDEIPIFDEISTTRYTPGISEYDDNLTAIGDYVRPMILKSQEQVPKSLHRETPIYFMATAGLRVLKGRISMKIIKHLSSFLENSEDCPFLFRKGHAQVLSGEEEAVFAWVAVNYLRGFFHKKENSSVGVLEMGGGSTQIVFVPKMPIYANKFIIHIGSTYYHTYAHSYLSFGQQYIINRVEKRLYSQSNGTNIVLDPCRLRGDNDTVTQNGKSVTLVGDGDADLCLRILQEFMNIQSPSDCSPKPCGIGTTYQTPILDMIFFAVAAFVYPTNIINSTDSNERLNMELMINNTRIYCKLTIDEAVQLKGNRREYASNNCISGVFIPLLLKKGYGFPQNTTSIYMKKKINNGTPDWSLGALIYQSELVRDGCSPQSLTTVPTSDTTRPLATTMYTAAIFVIMFIFHLCSLPL